MKTFIFRTPRVSNTSLRWLASEFCNALWAKKSTPRAKKCKFL